MITEIGKGISLTEVTLDDLEELVAIRISAMQESLERVGRFDPVRARARLVDGFDPQSTKAINLEGRRVGFYTLRQEPTQVHLDHLYLVPDVQGRGVGSVVIDHLLANRGNRSIYLGALRDSDANRFYERHGFKKVSEDSWDIYYIFDPVSAEE